jgi:hypothetical protein
MSDAGSPIALIPFAPKYRASGVLLHVSSLSSPYEYDIRLDRSFPN